MLTGETRLRRNVLRVVGVLADPVVFQLSDPAVNLTVGANEEWDVTSLPPRIARKAPFVAPFGDRRGTRVTLSVGAAQSPNSALWGVGDVRNPPPPPPRQAHCRRCLQDWTLGHNTWQNSTQLDAIRAIRAGVTRFPGGACSNYWNLSAADVVSPCENATCPNSGSGHNWCYVQKMVAAAPKHAFDTATFLAGPAAACTDGNAVIDLNLLHFDSEAAPGLVAAVLAAAAAAGRTVPPLTRFELGNEYYLPSDWGPNQSYGCSPVSEPAGYAARSRAVIAAVRRLAPAGAKIAAQGDTRELLEPVATLSWNAGVNATGLYEEVDAITLHDYDVKPAMKAGVGYQAAALAAWGQAQIRRIAGLAPKLWPGKPIWMTEYGIDSHVTAAYPLVARLNHGGIKAMHVLGRVLEAVASGGAFEVLQYYSFGGQGWGAEAGMLRWALDGSGRLEGDAVAQVFAHAAEVATRRGVAAMHAVTQSQGAPLMPWGPKGPPIGLAGLECLQAIALSSSGGMSHIVINRCNQTLNVALAGGQAHRWTAYACGPDSPAGFSPLPAPGAAFPWHGPLRSRTGASDDGHVAVGGTSVLIAEPG